MRPLAIGMFNAIAAAASGVVYVDPVNGDDLFQDYTGAASPWKLRPQGVTLGAPFITDASVFGDKYAPAIIEDGWSVTVYHAHASDPQQVVLGNYNNTPYLAHGDLHYPANSALSVTIPHFPAGMTTGGNGSTDQHCDIVDPSMGVMHSFWGLHDWGGGVWTAWAYGWTPLDGRVFGDPAHPYQGTRAAAVPASAGIIRTWEAHGSDTQYRHALTMSLDYSDLYWAGKYLQGLAYAFPATNRDGDSEQAGYYTAHVNYGMAGIVEGVRVMLPSDFDYSGLNGELQRICRTLMTYGAFLSDRNTQTMFGIYAERYTYAGAMGNYDLAPQYRTIAHALRPVLRQDSFLANDDSTSYAELPSSFNLMSMRGPWTNGAVYDTWKQAVVMPAGPGGTFVNDAYDVIRQTQWAGPTFTKTYRLTAHCEGGSSLQLLLMTGDRASTLNDSGILTDGQHYDLTFPQFDVIRQIARRGSGATTLKAHFDLRGITKTTVASVSVEDADPSLVLIHLTDYPWGTLPAAAAFALSGGVVISGVEWPGGYDLGLRVTIPLINGYDGTVSYVKPVDHPLHDADGNETDSFGPLAITNNLSIDYAWPVFSSAIVQPLYRNRIYITMDETLFGPLVAYTAFTCKVNTIARAVTAIAAVGINGFYITLGADVLPGDTVTYSYTPPGVNDLQDPTNNLTPASPDNPVTNNATPGVAIRLGDTTDFGFALVVSGDGTAGWNYAGTSGHSEYEQNGFLADHSLAENTDGEFRFNVSTKHDATDHGIGFLAVDNYSYWGSARWTTWAAGDHFSFANPGGGGDQLGPTLDNTVHKIRRIGSTITMEWSEDGELTWHVINTHTSQPTPQVFPGMSIAQAGRAYNLRGIGFT